MNAWVLDERKVLSRSEIRKLRRACVTSWSEGLPALRDSFMVELGLQSGLRLSEMVALEVRDVCLENGKHSLVVRRGKCGKRRVVSFATGFRSLAIQYLSRLRELGIAVRPKTPVLPKDDGTSVSSRLLQKRFKALVGRARLPETLTPHCLRHTYGTELYRASGKDLRLVQHQLGHSSITTTMVYVHLANQDTWKALERLYQ